MIVFKVIDGSAAGSLSTLGSVRSEPTLRWATRWELTINRCVLEWDVTETPDSTHLCIGGDFLPATAALNIEAATVPCAMIVTVLIALCLPARTMWHCPLRREIPLSD